MRSRGGSFQCSVPWSLWERHSCRDPWGARLTCAKASDNLHSRNLSQHSSDQGCRVPVNNDVGQGHMVRKAVATVIGLLAVAVLIPTAVITHGYIVRPRQVDSFGDWLGVLLPVLPPFVALLSCLLMWRSPRRRLIGRCVVWGACISCGAYMVLQGNGVHMVLREMAGKWGHREMRKCSEEMGERKWERKWGQKRRERKWGQV